LNIIGFEEELGFDFAFLAMVAGRMEGRRSLRHTAFVHSILIWPAIGGIQDFLSIVG
jgi:hypothetical protein